jgi:hypothetical protein
MTAGAVHGLDLIVYLEGHDKTPEAVQTKEKCTEAGLRSQFGGDDATVFLRKRNLQKLPANCTGVMVWLACMKSIYVVVKSNFELAHVQTLYPR